MSSGGTLWIKASASGSSGGDCVELGDPRDGEHVLVRHSKHPGEGTLSFTKAQMAAWIAGAKNGEFDHLLH